MKNSTVLTLIMCSFIQGCSSISKHMTEAPKSKISSAKYFNSTLLDADYRDLIYTESSQRTGYLANYPQIESNQNDEKLDFKNILSSASSNNRLSANQRIKTVNGFLTIRKEK